MRISSDMHIHTDLSSCCRSSEQTVENVISIAKERGLKKIGFADHFYWYRSMEGAANLLQHKKVHSRQWGLDVLVGCEADTRAPGIFCITHELKEKLDFVAMSASHFHQKKFIKQPVKVTPRGIADHLLKFFTSAASSGFPDVIVHPLFPFGYVDMYDAAINTISDAELIDVFGIAAENKVGIEINPCSLPDPERNRNFGLETPLRMFKLALKAGCKFTFGSDAHAPEELKNLQRLQYFADALNLSGENMHSLAQSNASG